VTEMPDRVWVGHHFDTSSGVSFYYVTADVVDVDEGDVPYVPEQRALDAEQERDALIPLARLGLEAWWLFTKGHHFEDIEFRAVQYGIAVPDMSKPSLYADTEATRRARIILNQETV